MLLSNLMPTDHIVALLIAEQDKLNRAIDALQGSATKPAATATAPTAADSTSPVPKKRHVSAAARWKMAAGQKRRWAAIKAAK